MHFRMLSNKDWKIIEDRILLELISRPDPKIGPDSLDAPWSGAPSLLWLVGPHRQRYKKNGRGPGHGTLSWPPPQPSPTVPIRSTGALGRWETSMTTDAHTVTGQCWWRPEGRQYPHRPLPPPDPLLSDQDFLAAIGAMAHQGSSSSAPPPADGLRPSTPLSLSPFLTCSRLELSLVNHLEPAPHTWFYA